MLITDSTYKGLKLDMTCLQQITIKLDHLILVSSNSLIIATVSSSSGSIAAKYEFISIYFLICVSLIINLTKPS